KMITQSRQPLHATPVVRANSRTALSPTIEYLSNCGADPSSAADALSASPHAGRISDARERPASGPSHAYNLGMRYILALFAVAAAGQGAVSFNRDIRPIMSDTCFR